MQFEAGFPKAGGCARSRRSRQRILRERQKGPEAAHPLDLDQGAEAIARYVSFHQETSATAESDDDRRPMEREDWPPDADSAPRRERPGLRASGIIPVVKTLMLQIMWVLGVAVFLVLGLARQDASGTKLQLDPATAAMSVSATPNNCASDGCVTPAVPCAPCASCGASHAPIATLAESRLELRWPDKAVRGPVQHDNLIPPFILQRDPPVPRAIA